MSRTKLKDRVLPGYTRGEEIFNMVSHIVCGGLGVAALALCVVFSSIKGDPWAIVGSSIYGASLVTLFTISSIYHGLHEGTAKKVMQVLDHCMIYFLIAGTYTPIVLGPVRRMFPGWGWTIFGIVWGFSALGTVFTAIDHKKYSKLSMACYIGIGWCVVLAVKPVIRSVPLAGLLLILAGGIAYTIGAVIYAAGKKKKKKYMHSIFHLFVGLGSILQFFAIFFYII